MQWSITDFQWVKVLCVHLKKFYNKNSDYVQHINFKYIFSDIPKELRTKLVLTQYWLKVLCNKFIRMLIRSLSIVTDR